MAPIETAIVAKSIPILVSALLKPIAEGAGKVVKEFTYEAWEKYKISLDSYLRDTQERHKYFSSEVFANEGKLLEDYYIPLTLQKVGARGVGAKVRIESFPEDLLSAYKDILIIDTAGMGKSTLLKYIFLKQLEDAKSIPIFVELRRISREVKLLDYIMQNLSIGDGSAQKKFLEKCLEDGLFTFYLDGFDEVADDDKKSVSADILRLKVMASKSRFVISSRQENSLASLAEFHRFRIKPLTEGEAYELIRLLSPLPARTDSLIEKLKIKSQHNLNEFLKNPLLVSLLVKSYIHSPILPVRLSEFYRQVFDALYQNHDAKKDLGGFSRAKESGLDLDRFHKAMRALGYLSYRASKLEFTRDEFLRQIEDVKSLTLESNYSASAFEDDLLRAVPLFVREGHSIRWAHRSLQEYFAASYICTDSKGNQEKILHRIYDRSLIRNANILKLCADIDEKTFKQTIVKRFLSEKIEELKTTFNDPNFNEIDCRYVELRRCIDGGVKMALFRFDEPVDYDETSEHLTEEAEEYLDNCSGYWELNEDLKAIGHDDDASVEYTIFDSPNDSEFLSELFEAYYAINIWKKIPYRSLDGISFSNVSTGNVFVFDDCGDNPLNSQVNFHVSTILLLNLKRKIFNVEVMADFLADIQQAEANAAALDIDFE